MDIEIEGAKSLDTFLDDFPEKASIALLRALKRGTSAARTHASRVISHDMALKVGDVRKRIRIIEPSGKTLCGELKGSLARVPTIEFAAKGPEPSRGKGRGVTYKPKGRLLSGFIATMASGHRGVFYRAGRTRLPIREAYGPSVGRVMDLHRQEILRRGHEQFETELKHQLDRIIGANGA